MRKSVLGTLSALSAILSCSLGLSGWVLPGVHHVAAGAREYPLIEWEPSFDVVLTEPQLGILLNAARNGLSSYGGDASFEVNGRAVGDGRTIWTVSIPDTRLRDVWTYWMSEYLALAVGGVNLESLSAEDLAHLDACKSAHALLMDTKARPAFEPVELQGVFLSTEGDGLQFLSHEGERAYVLSEEGLKLLPEGVAGVIEGVPTGSSTVRISNVREVGRNQLDVLVMSHCPFAREAMRQICRHFNADVLPRGVSVRFWYSFFPGASEGEFTSMRGEAEVQENLVQIVLRDVYPWFYKEYVEARSENETPWQELLGEVGATSQDLLSVQEIMSAQGQEMIRSEFRTVQMMFGGGLPSPTYFWEARKVSSLSAVPHFHTLSTLTNEECVGRAVGEEMVGSSD